MKNNLKENQETGKISHALVMTIMKKIQDVYFNIVYKALREQKKLKFGDEDIEISKFEISNLAKLKDMENLDAPNFEEREITNEGLNQSIKDALSKNIIKQKAAIAFKDKTPDKEDKSLIDKIISFFQLNDEEEKELQEGETAEVIQDEDFIKILMKYDPLAKEIPTSFFPSTTIEAEFLKKRFPSVDGIFERDEIEADVKQAALLYAFFKKVRKLILKVQNTANSQSLKKKKSFFGSAKTNALAGVLTIASILQENQEPPQQSTEDQLIWQFIEDKKTIGQNPFEDVRGLLEDLYGKDKIKKIFAKTKQIFDQANDIIEYLKIVTKTKKDQDVKDIEDESSKELEEIKKLKASMERYKEQIERLFSTEEENEKSNFLDILNKFLIEIVEEKNNEN